MSPTAVIEKLDQLIQETPPDGKLPLAMLLAARVTQLTGECINLSPTDENLSVEEAARRLGVSRKYLYAHSRTLPFVVRVGSRLLFSSQGLAAWMKARRGR
jgi:excisionase family DNA binding protein